jgi:hypothetical protein
VYLHKCIVVLLLYIPGGDPDPLEQLDEELPIDEKPEESDGLLTFLDDGDDDPFDFVAAAAAAAPAAASDDTDNDVLK